MTTTMFLKGLAALINLFPHHQVIFDAAGGKQYMDQLAAGNTLHIILMDIGMPKSDGYEVTAWIKEQYPDIRVSALSTMDSEAAIIGMINNGARDMCSRILTRRN